MTTRAIGSRLPITCFLACILCMFTLMPKTDAAEVAAPSASAPPVPSAGGEIPTFESFEDPAYRDQNQLRSRWVIPGSPGDPSDVILDSEFVGDGKYSMKWMYDYRGNYACMRALYGFGPGKPPFPTPASPPESEIVAWSFWVKGDGSKNWLYLGVLTMDNWESWMLDHAVELSDTEPKMVVVPFSKFVLWDRSHKRDGKFASAGIREVWYGVRGPAPSKGTIYLDKMSFLTRAQYEAIQKNNPPPAKRRPVRNTVPAAGEEAIRANRLKQEQQKDAAAGPTPPLSITIKNGDFSKPIGGDWKKEGGGGSVFGFEHDTKFGHDAPGSMKTWVSSFAQLSRVEGLLSGNMQQVGDTVIWQGWIYSETAWKSSDKKLVLRMIAFENNWRNSREYNAFPDIPAKQWTFFSIEFSRWSEAVEFYWACIDMDAVGTFWFDDMKIVAKGKTP